MMFITRKQYEKNIRKAKKKAKKRATKNAMIDMNMRNEIQDVRREIYRITGNMNTSFDKEFVAVGNEIVKIKKELGIE
jgi:hypothetical protein